MFFVPPNGTTITLSAASEDTANNVTVTWVSIDIFFMRLSLILILTCLVNHLQERNANWNDSFERLELDQCLLKIAVARQQIRICSADLDPAPHWKNCQCNHQKQRYGNYFIKFPIFIVPRDGDESFQDINFDRDDKHQDAEKKNQAQFLHQPAC